MKKISLLAIILAAFALPMKSAQAASVTCPDSTAGIASIDTTPTTSTCFSSGTGDVDLSPLTLLDTNNGSDEDFNGALTIQEDPSTPGTGLFVISNLVAEFTNLVLVLVIEDINFNSLQWVAFNLGEPDGLWFLNDSNDQTLADVELWGSTDAPVSPPPMSAVPLPATFWLFGTALLGFAGLARRTKV